MVKIEVDQGAGFCFGVEQVIQTAESHLARGEAVYGLGEMVHNSREMRRLHDLGFKTIQHGDLAKQKPGLVLFRAHGEPPSTYQLAADNQVLYVDHHFCGEIPGSSNLQAHIDPSPDTCTSLIVDQLLHGKYRAWAVAAAFGDNLHESALQAAATLSLAEHEVTKLKELGELLNYNGYGPTVDDLHFPPAELYTAVSSFADPLDFLEESKVLATLRQGYNSDMDKALSFQPVQQNHGGRVFELPAESWARRVSGVFSNQKAQERPDLAHALLIRNADKTYRINVRAPLQNKKDADTLCRTFPTGGGRAAAAGINNLPQELLQDFLNRFEEVFGT